MMTSLCFEAFNLILDNTPFVCSKSMTKETPHDGISLLWSFQPILGNKPFVCSKSLTKETPHDGVALL